MDLQMVFQFKMEFDRFYCKKKKQEEKNIHAQNLNTQNPHHNFCDIYQRKIYTYCLIKIVQKFFRVFSKAFASTFTTCNKFIEFQKDPDRCWRICYISAKMHQFAQIMHIFEIQDNWSFYQNNNPNWFWWLLSQDDLFLDFFFIQHNFTPLYPFLVLILLLWLAFFINVTYHHLILHKSLSKRCPIRVVQYPFRLISIHLPFLFPQQQQQKSCRPYNNPDIQGDSPHKIFTNNFHIQKKLLK